jgi:hypothetical protein
MSALGEPKQSIKSTVIVELDRLAFVACKNDHSNESRFMHVLKLPSLPQRDENKGDCMEPGESSRILRVVASVPP